jgi:hypothetical protein
MDPHPPEPPPLQAEVVESIVEWLDQSAEWLRQDHEVARTHGHRISPEALAGVQSLEDAALRFRESYGLPIIGQE